MMSSNIAEVRRELAELRVDMAVMKREARVYRNLLTDITSLSSLMGIKGASDIRSYITLLYQLKAAYDAVQLARMAAGDPLAWIGAGVTVAATAINAGSLFISEESGSEDPQ